MKLYTKTGDDGTTGLFNGSRVSKTHVRIEGYGTVDEVNACMGLVAAELERMSHTDISSDDLAPLVEMTTHLQSRLFDVGADLATPLGSSQEDRVRRIHSGDVEELEKWIDLFVDKTAPISTFVLPGGTEAAARMHLARTISRRAERCVIELAGEEQVPIVIVHWLNRLSDLLFAASRYVNQISNVADVPWKQG